LFNFIDSIEGGVRLKSYLFLLEHAIEEGDVTSSVDFHDKVSGILDENENNSASVLL
jgi:hypothetical protein